MKIALLMMLLASAASAAPPTTAATSAPATAPSTTRSSIATSRPKSAADAVRSLLIFIVDRNRAGVEAVILRNPHAAILWSGEPLPPEKRDALVRSIETLEVRELDSGETYYQSDGRRAVVKDDDVGINRRIAQPMFPDHPNRPPLVVQRVEGVWRVDAAPLIESRKAAEAKRKRAQERRPIRPPPIRSPLRQAPSR